MEIKLYKKPKNPVIVVGFPGFGLVGNITTEFLIEHLKAELIGIIKTKEVQPLIAIHDGQVVNPIGIFYDKKSNMVVIHVITNSTGIEWALTESILKLSQDLNAKEIVSVEGVVGGEEEEPKSFFWSNSPLSKKKFSKTGADELKEGIVVGVTGALLLEKHLPVSCIFVGTHSKLPDSRAAAKAIEVLDKYSGLSVDYAPLIEQAKKFESKIKGMMEQGKLVEKEQDKKRLSYIS